MDEAVRPRDMADSRMSKIDKVENGGPDAGRVVLDHRRERARAVRPAKRDGGQAEVLQQRDARVVGEHVGEEHAVDAAVGGESSIASRLGRGVGRHLKHQRKVTLGELDSTPAMNAAKNGSEASSRAGRATTSPIAYARRAGSARARRFGRHPSSSAAPRMRWRVAGETPGRPFNAKDTAPLLTPARSATSAIVGRPDVTREPSL